MTMQPVKSSNIESIGYDSGEKSMQVKFRGGGTHQYCGVSAAVHAAFMSASSPGSHFAQHIRWRYEGKKL